MEIVMRVTLKPGTDPMFASGWLTGLVSGQAIVTHAVALTPEENAQEERLRQVIHIEGLPSLEETSHMYVRFTPDVREPLTRPMFGLLRVFIELGVQRGQKALLCALKKIDLDEWNLATEDTARAAYSRLAAFLASTPWPAIKRRGVYGLACQEAATQIGRRSKREWKPEEEI